MINLIVLVMLGLLQSSKDMVRNRGRRKALAEHMDFAVFRELGLAYKTAGDQAGVDNSIYDDDILS